MNSDPRELAAENRIQLAQDPDNGIAADCKAPPITEDQRTELSRRLRSYGIDKNRGRLAVDVLTDVRRRL